MGQGPPTVEMVVKSLQATFPPSSSRLAIFEAEERRRKNFRLFPGKDPSLSPVSHLLSAGGNFSNLPSLPPLSEYGETNFSSLSLHSIALLPSRPSVPPGLIVSRPSPEFSNDLEKTFFGQRDKLFPCCNFKA